MYTQCTHYPTTCSRLSTRSVIDFYHFCAAVTQNFLVSLAQKRPDSVAKTITFTFLGTFWSKSCIPPFLHFCCKDVKLLQSVGKSKIN